MNVLSIPHETIPGFSSQQDKCASFATMFHVFCSGVDQKALAGNPEPQDPQEIEHIENWAFVAALP
eukprot:6167500-Amphidinium_carterae.1